MTTSKKMRFGAAAILVVVAMIWVLQNGGSVETKFLFFTVIMPQPVLLAITFLVGIAVGILVAWSLSEKWKKPKNGPSTVESKR